MLHVMLLIVLCADQPAEAPKSDDTGAIPKYVRRYFERSDTTKEMTQRELKKQLDELAVKIKSAQGDSKAELTRQRAQVEKALRSINSNTRCWLPAGAEVGEIGSLNTGTVRAVFDKRTMAVDFVVGTGDRFEPQFGVIVKGGGGNVTMKAIIQRWSTTGYVAEKTIPEDELFRVISTEPDPEKLKLAFGGSISSGEALELERIPRGEVMKWRAQYDKEAALLAKEPPPHINEPAPGKPPVNAKVATEPVELPKSVAMLRDRFAGDHNAALEKLASDLEIVRESQAKAKTAADKKELARRAKDLEAALAKSKTTGPIYAVSYLPDQPNVGDLGFVKAVVVVDVIDNSSAIVKRPEQLAIVGPERRGTPVAYYSVVITGVDTTDWPKGRGVEIGGFFEATHVDKSTRLVVLKPFDYTKWKDILEEHFGGFVSLRLESTDFSKWENTVKDKAKNKAAK